MTNKELILNLTALFEKNNLLNDEINIAQLKMWIYMFSNDLSAKALINLLNLKGYNN
jgi:hypothetical protein